VCKLITAESISLCTCCLSDSAQQHTFSKRKQILSHEEIFNKKKAIPAISMDEAKQRL